MTSPVGSQATSDRPLRRTFSLRQLMLGMLIASVALASLWYLGPAAPGRLPVPSPLNSGEFRYDGRYAGSMTSTVEPAALSRSKGRTFSLRALMIGMLAASVLLAGLWYMGRAVTKARQASMTAATQGPLNQVLLALHNYHGNHGSLPPAYIVDKHGKPMHSWRVLILPYLDEHALYQAYRFEEPWNSPHNLSLADSMPRSFLARTEPASRRNTNVVVIVGPDTAFPGANSTKFDDFKDGMGNTILVTEIANSDICWLEPRDLDTATMSFQVNDRKKPSISSIPWRQPYAVFADSIHAYPVPTDTPPETLRGFTTIAGGEATKREQILPDNP